MYIRICHQVPKLFSPNLLFENDQSEKKETDTNGRGNNFWSQKYI